MAAPNYYFFSGTSHNPLNGQFPSDISFGSSSFLSSFVAAEVQDKIAAVKKQARRWATSNKTWLDAIQKDLLDSGGFTKGMYIGTVADYSETAVHSTGGGGGGGSVSKIYKGSTVLDSISIGSTAISKVYVGSTQVWGSGGGGGSVTQNIFYPGYEIKVTAPGSSAYSLVGWDKNGSFTATNNKNLAVVTGSIIKFDIDASGHPFWIKTVQGNGTGNTYQNHDYIAANAGKVSGTMYFSPPSTGTWYYNCEYHGAMTGTITVTSS